VGLCFGASAKIEEARRAFDRAVIIQPDSYTLTHRADFLIGQKKLAEAIADFSEVLKLDSSHLGARLNRANALAQLGEYDKSLEDYNVALRTHTGDSRVYSGRGWVFQRQGLIGRAREEYRRALELAPTDPRLQKALTNLPAD
jgi:tetratricopeptide (TPR) repeat protein